MQDEVSEEGGILPEGKNLVAAVVGVVAVVAAVVIAVSAREDAGVDGGQDTGRIGEGVNFELGGCNDAGQRCEGHGAGAGGLLALAAHEGGLGWDAGGWGGEGADGEEGGDDGELHFGWLGLV